MTFKQRLFNLFYPVVRHMANRKHAGKEPLINKMMTQGNASFYTQTAILPDGRPYEMQHLKGKKILIVNTASNCGYTPQYRELEKLHRDKQNKLVILAFPSSDFKNQEPGSDEEIASFCERNYGISFPLLKKDSVLNPAFQKLYVWLTDKSLNGWNEQAPTWNFCKYLVSEDGVLLAMYGPEISPRDMAI